MAATHADERSETALRGGGVESGDGRVKAVVVTGAQHTVGGGRRVDGTGHFVTVAAQWLFTQNVTNRLQGDDTDCGQDIVCRRHFDEIHVGVANRRRPVGEGDGSVVAGQACRTRLVHFTDGDQV